MAIMLGEQRLQQFSLGNQIDEYELFTSCEPCAMCMGAILWSGVKRLACAATGDDARAIGLMKARSLSSHTIICVMRVSR